MTDASHAGDRFWADLAQVRTGLLSLAGTTHAAPMTAHWEDHAALFFFAPRDGVLARHIAAGVAGEFLYTGSRHDLYAVVAAELTIADDADLRRRLWSDEVETWFPGGPDGPRAALLRAELGAARIWLAAESGDGHDERATVALDGSGGPFVASGFGD